MKREELQERVEAAAGPDLRGTDHLKAAIYDFVKLGGPFYPSAVGTVLQEAGRRREQADADVLRTPPAPRTSPRPKAGADAHFVSRVLVEGLKPWTEGLRQESEFGSVDPPFLGDEGAAADYIEKTSAADLARWLEARADNEGDHERTEQLERQLALDLGMEARFLPYRRLSDDHRKDAPVVPGTFLFKLACEIDRVSQRTGFLPGELTAHVFTGAVPLMPRVRHTYHENLFRAVPSGKQVHLRSVTLTFRAADLTFEELRALYDGVKNYMGSEGVQAPTREDFEFWKLVEDMGGPPEPYHGVREFWREVLRKWNQEYSSDTPLKSWEGLQKRYRRLCKRLGIQ